MIRGLSGLQNYIENSRFSKEKQGNLRVFIKYSGDGYKNDETKIYFFRGMDKILKTILKTILGNRHVSNIGNSGYGYQIFGYR